MVPSNSCKRLSSPATDPEGSPGLWRVTLPDGREVRWEGFYSGPLELTGDEVEGAARHLLGMSATQVPAEAAARLLPSTHDDGSNPCVVIHGATPVLKNLQGDLEEVTHGRIADDTATYLETRAVKLARPGDLVVGRTVPWRAAAAHAGVEAVVIPGVDYYYLSQALVQFMVASRGKAPQIQRLVDALKQRPDTVIRLYSMDLELQIALLYLCRLAGIDHLLTDANSPEVANYWNTKAPIYPRAVDAVEITAAPARAQLDAETELTPMRRRLGLSYERLPGYAIDAGTEGELLLGARLMRERYGFTSCCFKPSRGGGGARIVTDFDLTDEERLRWYAREIQGTGELFLLEAQVTYGRVMVGSQSLRLAPSVHVRNGQVIDGLTLQLTVGPHWHGNVHLDERGCEDLGIGIGIYRSIRRTVAELHDSLAAKGFQLVTGGVDFAVGSVDGVFGDELFVAMQDPNLSSHGAEYLRRFVDDMRVKGGPAYAVTKVIRPALSGHLPALLEVRHAGLDPRSQFDVVCTVPGRWGMLAAAATTPHLAIAEVLEFERVLVARGLVR